MTNTTTDNFSEILLFTTNASKRADKLFLHSVLDCNTAIEKWNIDLDDQDCVLRIVSYSLTHQYVIDLMNSHGYICHELI